MMTDVISFVETSKRQYRVYFRLHCGKTDYATIEAYSPTHAINVIRFSLANSADLDRRLHGSVLAVV